MDIGLLVLIVFCAVIIVWIRWVTKGRWEPFQPEPEPKEKRKNFDPEALEGEIRERLREKLEEREHNIAATAQDILELIASGDFEVYDSKTITIHKIVPSDYRNEVDVILKQRHLRIKDSWVDSLKIELLKDYHAQRTESTGRNRVDPDPE